MIDMNCVYWIRHQDHTDITTQGYVGISNDFGTRLRNHKSKPCNTHMQNVINKYGWDNLIKEQVLIGDADYCKMIEIKLRPHDFIGWNQTCGGSIPPKPQKGHGQGRKLSEEHKEKLRKYRTGKKYSMETREKIRESAIAQWERYRANGNKHTPEEAE